MGSKAKVNLDALCIKTCAQYSPIIFKLHVLVVDGERGSPIGLRLRFKCQGKLWPSVYSTFWVLYRLVFVRSLSNLTCKLSMMSGGTLLILGHDVKFQGQLWPPERGCYALRCLVSTVVGKSHARDLIHL